MLSASAIRILESTSEREVYRLYRTRSYSPNFSDHGLSQILLESAVFDGPLLIPEAETNLTEDAPCLSQDPRGCPYKRYIVKPHESVHLQPYYCWFGDPDIFGVYSPLGTESYPTKPFIEEMPLKDITMALRHNLFDDRALMHLLSELDSPKSEFNTHFRSLDALLIASDIYERLDGAKVDLRVISRPLYTAKWLWYPPSPGRSFACIAMLEHGTANIDTKELTDVIALSIDNSLYIADYILRDPFDSSKEGAITRTIGNIGRPGLSFLVSPKALQIKSPDYSSWKEINHADYNGETESNFQETSLHLRLTGYESPFVVGDHGLYDHEVFMLHAVVQAFDRGVWVADLDLASVMLAKSLGQLCRRLQPCNHSQAEHKNFHDFGTVMAIDSWDEFLDPPSNTFVVRAKDNWLARLAIAAVSSQKRQLVLLVSQYLCWQCIRDAFPDRPQCVIVH